MNKQDLINLVEEYGDAIITYRSVQSKKLKYNVCTLDFSTKYISDNKVNKARETEDTVLMFCWDSDSFRLIRPATVTSVIPLSSIQKGKNGRK